MAVAWLDRRCPQVSGAEYRVDAVVIDSDAGGVDWCRDRTRILLTGTWMMPPTRAMGLSALCSDSPGDSP
jgi:hypothetical protein